MQFPHLWIHLCRLHLFFSISKARSSHTFTESSTFWPLCHSSHPLTYIGIPWRAQKDSGQEWTSAVFVFHVLGTDFLSLFSQSLGLALCLFIPCRNHLSGGCWGGLSHNSGRYDCRGLVLLLLLERSYTCRYMLCFRKFVQCKTSSTILVHFTYSDFEGKQHTFHAKQKVTFQDQIYWVESPLICLRDYFSN